jgi:dTDP-4-dehydrorhamnose 3,5-epimerase
MTTEFKITPTNIPGLLEIDISMVSDERGYFQEKFQKEKLMALGLPKDFSPVQQNISYNKLAAVLRGIHAEPWEKYISVIKGSVFAAFVDLRKASFGQSHWLHITPNKAVFVPRGVANSYQTLEADVIYNYLVNDFWSADKTYKAVNAADPKLAIPWPMALEKSIISEKDKNNPMLESVEAYE